MAVRNADGPVAAVAAVVGEDKRDDSGEVALKCQHEQVAQEPQVLLIVGRDAERPRIFCHSQVNRGSARAIRCSSSRTPVRYSSSLRRSAAPSV